MRPSFVRLATLALLAGCAPMPGVVYAPTPGSAPEAQAPMPPVGVTIVDADDDRVLVSTNQPAHVAVFEIIQGRGVRLVYPVSPKQRRVAQAGSGWLMLAASRGDDRMARGDRYDRVLERSRVRYLYALASERPLWLNDSAFDDEWLGTMLGSRAASAIDPYETMQAISRRFLPPAPSEEEWGEDLYRIESVRRGQPTRIAKVYCPDGSIVYVRDDEAEREGCPWGGRDRGRGTRPAGAPRPDSVVSSTGRHVASRPGPRLRTPVFRVPRTTTDRDSAVVRQAGSASGSRPEDAGTRARGDSASARNNGREGKDERDEHHDNGRHTGWDKVTAKGNGNGNDGAAKGNGSKPDARPPVEQKPPVVADTARRPAGGAWGRLRPTAPAPVPTPVPVPVEPSRTVNAPVVPAPAPATQPTAPATKPDSAVRASRPREAQPATPPATQPR